VNKPLKPVNFHIVKKEYHRDSMKELAINYAFEQCSLYKYDLYTNISVIVESKGREYKHNFKVTSYTT